MTSDQQPTTVGDLALAGFVDAVEVGRGGFGVVFRCHERSVGRTVAVKVLNTGLDATNRARFFREGQAMGRLSGHPNVVEVLQVGETSGGRPFIVMPFLARGSLAEHVERDGPVSWSDAARMGVRLAGALESAHLVGTLHRDVKPGNVLLSDYNEVQLTDFGIARMQGGFETARGLFIGSVVYSAPDVLEGGPPSPLSDVYSLGATLFTILAGHAAFAREPDEELVAQYLRIRHRPVPDLRGGAIPDDLCAVLEQAMAKDPDDRPQMTAFGRALQEVQKRAGLAVAEMAVPAAPLLRSGTDDDAPLPAQDPMPGGRSVPSAGMPSSPRPPVTARMPPSAFAGPVPDRPAPAQPGPTAVPRSPSTSPPAPTRRVPASSPASDSGTAKRRWTRFIPIAVLVLLLLGAITLAVVIGVRAISTPNGAGAPVDVTHRVATSHRLQPV